MSSKVDLLKRVNELQLEIQKNKELLRDAMRKDAKFAEFNKKSIKMDEVKAIRELRLNKKEYKLNEEKIPIKDKLNDDRSKESTVSKEQSVSCYSNEQDGDKMNAKNKSVERQFLGLISKSVFTSIDSILSDQSLNSSLNSPKCILILCQERNIHKIQDELNPNLDFVKLNRKSFKNAFGTAIKFGIISLQIYNLEPNLIDRTDEIIFYQFNLIKLWETIKILNPFLQRDQKMYAIIDARLMMFLTEFKEKIKFNF